jgi:hypothetical protein
MTPSPESRLLDLIRKKSGPSLKDRGRAWLKKTLNWVDQSSVDSDAFWLWANGCLALTLAGTLIYAGFVFLGRENPARPERPEAPLTFSEAQRVERKPPPSDLTRRDLFKDMAPSASPAAGGGNTVGAAAPTQNTAQRPGVPVSFGWNYSGRKTPGHYRRHPNTKNPLRNPGREA